MSIKYRKRKYLTLKNDIKKILKNKKKEPFGWAKYFFSCSFK